MNYCQKSGCAQCSEDLVGSMDYEADGIFIKQMHIKKEGTTVPQHSHKYDHVSMLARGSVHVWADGIHVGKHVAPHGIFIKAGVKHKFLSLEDDTIIYCVHNVARAGVPEVKEEHQLGES